MGFAAPWFLAGLFAAGLPIWLHLLKRHRQDPVQFPSLMFFERSLQSSVKHRRLMYLLLLALRLAVLVLLALAFANPFLNRPAAAVNASSKIVVAVVDRSYSMQAGNLLDQAKRGALDVIRGVRGRDKGQVLALSGRAEILTSASSDRPELEAAIAGIQPGDSRASYGELGQILRSLAETARQPLEVHLFTDMQKSALPPGFNDLRMGLNTTLILHPLTHGGQGNFTVENVVAPRSLGDPKRTRIQATVSGYGTKAAKLPVSLWLNGRQVAAKLVDLPANGRGSVEFLGLDAPYGWSKGEVRIEANDAFAADDVFRFSTERADARRILFVRDNRQARAGYYFRSALEASTATNFSIDEITPDTAGGVEPGKFAFVVLNDPAQLPASFEDNLKRWVTGGGRALITGGPGLNARGKVPLLELPVEASRYATRTGERFLTVVRPDLTHPSFRQSGRLEGVKIYQAVRVEPAKDVRIAARLNDDTPLLMEQALGEGRVLLFASGFDNIGNDLPIHPSFVPFVEQTALYLSNAEERPAVALVDSFVELRAQSQAGGPAAGRAAAVEVLDPKGQRALTLDESTKVQSVAVNQAGFWEIVRPNGRRELVAVNPDRRESDLAPMPKEMEEIWRQMSASGSGPGGAAAGSTPEKPWNFWWYVALLLLVATLAESLFAGRYLKVERG